MGRFMLSLAKADNFDMTLMMAGDDERALIAGIIESIRAKDGALADQVSEAYTE